MKETIAAVVGFYPAFSPLSVCSLSFIYLHLSYMKQLCLQFSFFPLLSPTSHPSMPVFKVHLLPLLPLAPLFTDSRAVFSSVARGPVHAREEKETSVLPTTPCQCIVFQHGKKSDFIWRLVFVFFFRSGFKCCKKHKLPSVCQDLHPKRNYYYVVGLFFFIIYHS